jgi:predicted dehydrogenase
MNVGLVGYGYWGPNLARNFSEIPGVELRAIADASPDRRDLAIRRYPRVETYADATTLLNRDDLDVILIATPIATHYPVARAAIDRGKHVFVEKPLTASRSEAEDLAEQAAKQNVTVMVDHTFVYTGAVRKMRELIDAGDLGELLYLDSVRVNLGLFQQDSNVVWDLAVHDLAILDYLIDERPISVSAEGSAVAEYRHENVAYITVHFASGFLGHFHVNWLAPVKIRRMLLGGRQRLLVFDDMDPSEKVRVYDKGVDFNRQDGETREEILVSYRTGDMFAPKLDRSEALALAAREFVDAIEKGREPLTGLSSGIHVVHLLEAAEQSLRLEGRRVKL